METFELVNNTSLASRSIGNLEPQYSPQKSNNQELSELGFFSQLGIGVKNEWEISEDIYAIVLETTEKKTILKCAINKEKNEFQNRIFDTGCLRKITTPKKGSVILIKQRQGVVNNEYQNLLSFADGNGIINNPKEYFEIKNKSDDSSTFDISLLGEIV